MIFLYFSYFLHCRYKLKASSKHMELCGKGKKRINDSKYVLYFRFLKAATLPLLTALQSWPFLTELHEGSTDRLLCEQITSAVTCPSHCKPVLTRECYRCYLPNRKTSNTLKCGERCCRWWEKFIRSAHQDFLSWMIKLESRRFFSN